ncbi:MAG: hypothetical protein AAGI28_16450 [Pseudomonadota bacterium]
MALAPFTAFHCSSVLDDQQGRAPETLGTAQTSAELLKTFLSSDTLIWGCLALALIAVVTVSRVVSRRRSERRVNRRARAQSQAVHEFLSNLRTEHGGVEQGIWHYDFATGAQQCTDGFKGLLGLDGEDVDAGAVASTLARSGVNLIATARKNCDEIEPYEVTLTVKAPGARLRRLVLVACNIRNGDGEVQRLVAVLREVGG